MLFQCSKVNASSRLCKALYPCKAAKNGEWIVYLPGLLREAPTKLSFQQRRNLLVRESLSAQHCFMEMVH